MKKFKVGEILSNKTGKEFNPSSRSKSIADELDKTTLLDFVDEIKSYDDLSYKLFDYVKPFESDIKDNWYEIFLAYLNPLTRDFVEVVEDE